MNRFRVKLTVSAYNDLKRARSWYKQHNKELPSRFTDQVNSSISMMQGNPFVHAVRYRDVRIANTKTFPYAIHYIIEDDVIVVIAIHHAAADPANWIERL